ncbi:hypothetical protein M2149_000774 [Lachnospiraceae bacterium PFB1-21]
MEYTFLTKDGDFKFACSTESKDSLQLYDTKYLRRVDTPSEVFEGYFLVKDKNGDEVEENDILLFKYENQYREFKIQELEVINGEAKIYAENMIMEVTNEDAQPLPKPPDGKPFWWYMKNENLSGLLEYTDIEININEISDQRRQLEYTGTTEKKITRLIDILTSFGAEAEILPVLAPGGVLRVVGHIMNVYVKRGAEILSDQLIDDVNIQSVEMRRSLKSLRNAIDLKGAKIEGSEQYVTITDIDYDDGEYYSPRGASMLFSRKSMDKWGAVNDRDKALMMSWSYDTQDPNELLSRGKNELQKYDDVTVNFAVEGIIEGQVGNMITVSSEVLGREIYLHARIIQHEICLEDRTKDKVTAGDFVETQSEIDKAVKAMQDELAKLKLINAVVIAEKSQFVNLVEDNSFTCFLYVNDEDADVEGALYRYDWTVTFYGADGAEISSINKTGKAITVLASDWPSTAVSMNYELEWGLK